MKHQDVMCTTLPTTNQVFRDAIYQGTVFHLGANAASREMVEMAYEILRKTFGAKPRQAQRVLPKEAFFTAMGKVRKEIYTSTHFHRVVRRL